MYSIGLGLTSICNMDCSFCYSKEQRKPELDIPIETWINFFDNNHKQIKDLNYGTGENTLVNDWYKLVDYLHSNYPEIKQALTTNGSLIKKMNDLRLRKIITESISEIDISLDYGNPIQHNAFRKNKNAYNWATRTLAFCQEYNINPTLVVMGIEDNLQIENMEKIFEIANKYDSLVRINLYRPVQKNNSLEPPSLNSIIKLIDWVNENHMICSLSDPLFSSIFTNQEIRADPSGHSSIRILPNGFIFPSTYLIKEQFQTFHISKEEVLSKISEHEVFKRITSSEIPIECKDCTIVTNCNGGTIDRRYLWYNDLSRRDPYCPKNVGLSEKLRNYSVNLDKFESIHDGYLPTMFFRGKK